MRKLRHCLRGVVPARCWSAARRWSAKLRELRSDYGRWFHLLGAWGTFRLWLDNRVASFLARRHPRLCRVRLRGYTQPLSFRMRSSDKDVIWQVFGRREYEVVANEKDIHLIVDCGANIGCSSFYFLHRYPDAHVIAVEPDPGNFRLCQLNLAPFGDRVTLINSGVWSQRVPLRVERGCFRDGREWSFQVRPVNGDGAAEFMATTIDELIVRSGRGTIDLLKIDIEGAEQHLFGNGAAEWLERTRTLAIELHGPECQLAFDKALEGSRFRRACSGELTLCWNLTDINETV